jgi:hypothetical protein
MDLKIVRKKVNNMLMGTYNVDKSMTDKVNDYILVEEQPLPIQVGERTIYIGNLTIDNNFKFWEMYGQLMAMVGLKFVNFELISNTAELFKAIMIHRKLYKGLCKIIKKTILKQQAYYLNDKKERKKLKWKNCNYRYFKKHITMEKLLQICYLIWLFNFDAEKKNLKILLGQVAKGKKEKHTLETYMYFWLQNLAGMTGKFQLALLTNVDYWHKEAEREIVSISNKRKKKVKNVS